jgi:hypothetical protein
MKKVIFIPTIHPSEYIIDQASHFSKDLSCLIYLWVRAGFIGGHESSHIIFCGEGHIYKDIYQRLSMVRKVMVLDYDGI